MSFLLRGARKIRHLPLLEKQDFLWNTLRKPFHKALALNGGGVDVDVSGLVRINMPPEFTSLDLSSYERDSISALVDWLKDKKRPLFIDIGSSIGIFSAVALSANATVDVIAIDSDIESIAAVERICRKRSSRLTTICGFISDRGRKVIVDEAAALTFTRKVQQNARGGVGDTRYICIDGHVGDDIPYYTVDDLFKKIEIGDIMVKIDVEGAEEKVLRGSGAFAAKYRPTLLMSVHPSALAGYNSSIESIKHWLHEFDYVATIIAVDHEEHWLCLPN